MSVHHCEHDCQSAEQIVNLPRYRRVLWLALFVNATMFLIEIGAGYASGSLALLADSIDFGGDALNYGVSLAVLASGLAWRARAAIFKAICMMLFGLFLFVGALWSFWHGGVPNGSTMGVVAVMGLIANLVVAWMLYAYREGDANMRSVWLCTRNDAIGNIAVFVAALGVMGTQTAWPDLLVAALMAVLAFQGGWSVLRQAKEEVGSSTKET